MDKTTDTSTFQGLIFALQQYWSAQGCNIMQPLDMEVGAGTFHPATFLKAIGPESWRAAYVQPSRVLPMAGMAKTQTAYSTISNFRSLSNHRRLIFKNYT